MACSTTETTAPEGSQSNPFQLLQGTNFDLEITMVYPPTSTLAGQRFSLDGYTGRGQMRVSASDVGTPVAEFQVTILSPQTGLQKGVAVARILPSDSVSIPVGIYVFDIEFENNLDPEDILNGGRGYINVVQEVTK